MLEINQTVLISSITVITIILAIIGIQVAFVFREFRRTIEKFNKILDDGGVVSGSVSKSVKELSGFTAGVKTALNVFDRFKPKDKKNG